MTGFADEDGAFHEGERAIQERTGERSQALRNAPLIATAINGPARAFLAAQPPGAHGDS